MKFAHGRFGLSNSRIHLIKKGFDKIKMTQWDCDDNDGGGGDREDSEDSEDSGGSDDCDDGDDGDDDYDTKF